MSPLLGAVRGRDRGKERQKQMEGEHTNSFSYSVPKILSS